MSEEKQVTDEELVQALHTIKKYCGEVKDCHTCMLCQENNNECIFNESIVSPCEWDLTIRKTIF